MILYEKDLMVFTERELRAALPSVSLPEMLLPEHVAEFGFIPYVEPLQLEPTPEELAARLQADVVWQTQRRLDDFARTRNYDGILSLCTYAASSVPQFAAEGRYGVSARDATWAKLYAILAEVHAGTRPMPSSFVGIESELPQLGWPESMGA